MRSALALASGLAACAPAGVGGASAPVAQDATVLVEAAGEGEGLPLIVPAAAAAAAAAPAVPAPPPRPHRDAICVSTGPRPVAPPARAMCCYVGQESIRRIVMARGDGYRGCYDQALARDDRAAGRFVGRFTVDQDGLVRSACEVRNEGVPDAVDDPALVRCVLEELTKVTFPELGDECPTMTIMYPLRFGPEPAAM